MPMLIPLAFALALNSQALQAPIDRIVIVKSSHTLALQSHGQIIATYTVALGSRSGPKQKEGDRRTPEGLYTVDGRLEHSAYHRALHLSYPNAADEAQARKQGKPPGTDIEIHGQKPALTWLGSLQRTVDWTAGCIALTDAEIDSIWPLVPIGTPVEIKP